MPATTDITIIGSGINGLLTAKALAEAGATVTVIDQNTPGQEASWAGGGILLPLYPWRQDVAITRLVIDSLKIYPQLALELIEVTGIDPEWTQCGLYITDNPDIDDALDWCQSNGIDFSTSSPDALAAIQGQRHNPLWLPEIAQIRNPRLLKALAHYLSTRQIRFIDNCQLLQLNITNKHLQSITTSTGQRPVEHLVLATGAWSGVIWNKVFPEQHDLQLHVEPVKGQMLLFDAEPGVLTSMVLDGDRYLIPRRDGKILAGSTVEHTGFDKQTTDEARSSLKTFALELLPALEAYPISHHWAGLRPGTHRGIPYIDTHPEIDNISVNCGHFRNGLAMGPASARLLTDLICNRQPTVAPEPYRLTANH